MFRFFVVVWLISFPALARAQPDAPPPVLLPYDQAVTGSLDDAAPRAVFAFDALRGEVLSVRLTVTRGDLLPSLIVTDGGGAVIAAASDGGTGFDSLAIPRTDRYALIVGRFGGRLGATSGAFTLEIARVGVSSASGSALRYGDSVINTLDPTQTQFFYPFQARRGDVITLRLQRVSGDLDPMLILTDADGTVLAQNDDSGDGGLNAGIDGFLIRADGTYIVVATRFGGAAGTTTGGFVLSLLSAADSGLGRQFAASYPLEYGAIIEGDLTDAQNITYYRFEGRAGDVIRVRMERIGGALDPLLAITDADARELVSDDDGGGGQNALIDGYTLPADGAYTVLATRYERAAGSTTGRYRLTLERTAGVE
jgi:hypothetical protein